MTHAILDAGFGPSSPSSGPDWPRFVGALLVAAILLFVSGPFYCAAPVPPPARLLPDDPLAHYATTWSHSTAEGVEG